MIHWVDNNVPIHPKYAKNDARYRIHEEKGVTSASKRIDKY